MKFYVDRIENDKVVCVTSDGKIFNIPKDILDDAIEGDRYLIKKDVIENKFIMEKNQILIDKVFK